MRTSRPSPRLLRRPTSGIYRSARPVSVRTQRGRAATKAGAIVCRHTRNCKSVLRRRRVLFKSSSSPRRAAHASHSCERRPTRTAIQVEHAAFLGAAPQQALGSGRRFTPDRAAELRRRQGRDGKDGRPPPRMGRLTLIYKLHRVRRHNNSDGRARTALLCLETKRRRTLAVLRGQHLIDHLPRPRPRRDPRAERLRRWFCESLRFAGRESVKRLDGPPQPGQLLSTSSIRRVRGHWWG